MEATPSASPPCEGGESCGADILTLGFGTSVAMWAAGFFCRLPAGPVVSEFDKLPDASHQSAVPAQLLFALLLLCMFGGSFLAGKLTARGWRGGLYTALISSVLNLLVLMGIVGSSQRQADGVSPLVVPGFLLFSAVLGALGGAFGARFRRENQIDWRMWFAAVAAAATLLLILVGGLVTGFKAGLAVPDWPNTFGYLMFFYPLSKMTGGIYFEHSHRLLGTLVGLTVIVLTIHTFATDKRGWLRGLMIVALLLVIAQGIMGGLRVTGRLTLSDSKTDMAPSTALAIVHGITAQVFFALLTAIAAFSSRRWREAAAVKSGSSALQQIVPAVLLLQLILGAVLRHSRHFLLLHIALAAVALLLTAVVGVRAWGRYEAPRPAGTPVPPPPSPPARIGKLLVVLAVLQTVFGLAALHMLGLLLQRQASSPRQVIVTTAHQTVGALLLAATVLLLVWTRKTPEAASAGLPGRDNASAQA